MKKLFTSLFILLNLFCFGQEENIIWNYHTPNPSTDVVAVKIPIDKKLLLTVTDLASVAEFNDFVQNSTIGINGTTTKLETLLQTNYAANYTALQTNFTITDIDLRKLLPQLNVGDKLQFVLKEKATTKTYDSKIDAQVETSNDNSQDSFEQWIDSQSVRIGGNDISLSQIYNNQNRYDVNENRVYLLVDEGGNLIGNNPVNIDQDDIIYVIMIVDKAALETCNVDFIGTYGPVDLQMRSFEALGPKFTANSGSSVKNLRLKVFQRGPFTSENVVVKIKKSGNLVGTYTLKVNKLFHLGFGVGVNISDLTDPDYEISALNGTSNTITKINDSKRTMISFNVVWYWSSTIKYLQRGSSITRGRDILKEPTFIERINPTFGISFDGKLRDNAFAGLNFEFARGGSVNLGYHWGKVTRLNLENFELGVTEFSGTAVPTTEVWDGRFFIGIMLDTRIINTLFNVRP